MISLRRLAPAAALLLSFSVLLPNTAAQGGKVYHENKLTWGDFNGGLPTRPDLDAQTATGYEVKPMGGTRGDGQGGFKTHLKRSTVKAYFDKNKSTKRPGAALTAVLLKHEQYHFDIAVVWARYLEEEIRKIEGCGATEALSQQDAVRKAKEAEQKNIDQCNRISAVYDLQTDHGRRAGPQAAWCAKIGQWLKALNAAGPKAEGEGETRIRSGPDADTGVLPRTIEVLGASVDVSGGQGAPNYATVVIDPLAVRGFHMGGTGLIGPASPMEGPAVLRVLDPMGGADLMRAHVRTMTGSAVGSQYGAWLEELEIREDVETSAPGIWQIQESAGIAGAGVPMIDLSFSAAIDLNATHEENVHATISLGTSLATDPADCDGDGAVNWDDVPFFEGVFYGTFPQLTPWAGDLDADGDVDIQDALLLYARLI